MGNFRKTSESSPKISELVGHKPFYTVKEVAGFLGLTPDTVSTMCKDGRIGASPVPYGKTFTYKIPLAAVNLHIQHREESLMLTKKRKTLKNVSKDEQSKLLTQLRGAMEEGTVHPKSHPYSNRTIDDYVWYLEQFFKVHDSLNYSTFSKELEKIPFNQYAKRERYQKACMCFARFLILIGMAEKDLLEAITKRPITKKPEDKLKQHRAEKTLSEQDVKNMFDKCKSFEDRLLLTVLYKTGVRASEFCDIRINDLDLENHQVLIRKGKGQNGGKSRVVGLMQSVVDMIKEYLEMHPEKQPPDWLMLNRTKGQMTRSGVYQRVQRIGEDAGVHNASPHGLRRSFVTIHSNKGGNIHTLSKMCGHSDIRTTQLYLNQSDKEMIDEVKGWE